MALPKILDDALDTLVVPGFSRIGYLVRAGQFDPLDHNALAGKTVEVNEEGYLVNPADWSKEIAVELAKQMRVDMKLVEEQCTPDENFTNTASPNPQNPESFDMAKEQGEANGSELLFATDPDADRFGLVVKHRGE